MSSEVGGNWVLRNPNGRSACYASLETNTPKEIMRFADFPLPEDWPDYPHHTQMRQWFNAYVDHFGFRHRIHFNTKVERAARLDDGVWSLSLSNGEVRYYDALIVANGNYWDAKIPSFPGHFNGASFHAHAYIDPTEPVRCIDKRVVVVGMGNTGCEIAVELSRPRVARTVWLSARSGNRIMPKYVNGKPISANRPFLLPTETVPFPFAGLPPRLRDWLFRKIFTRMVNKAMSTMPIQPQEVGLPLPPADATVKRIVANQHILQSLRDREVIAKQNIARFEGDTVVFTDGSHETADIVIYATGYRQSFPFFDDQLLGAPGDDIALYRNVMHPRYHNLFIVGMYRPLCAFWPLAEQQARWIAPLLTGEYALPRRPELDRRTFPILKIPAFNCAFYGHDLRLDTQRGKKRARRRNSQSPIQALAWRYAERGAEANLTRAQRIAAQR
jgi:cation diffusion facilitator CzcD-associated flavoprotein CzcO